MVVFLAVYEKRSIFEAAKHLGGVDPSIVSRRLSQLERKIGHSLFNRKSRPFEPTLDAHHIAVYAKEILYQREKINRYYQEKQEDDSRIIRVMLGNTLVNIAPKLIHEYSQMYPKLRFNMIAPMDVGDYLNGKADVIGVSSLIDLPNNILLPRRKFSFIPVASPKYIEKYGPINHPSELANHRIFTNLYNNRYAFTVKFPLVKKGERYVFSGIQNIRWLNAAMVVRSAVEGYGIAISLSAFQCIDELEAGRLVPVLNGWHRPTLSNYIAVKEDDWKIKNIRMFASWWAEKVTLWETDCERRLARLYGEDFLENLFSD